jgi:hypothetical protein
VRVTNQVFPHAFVIPLSTEMTITQWQVPVDDETCYWYAIFTSFGAPVEREEMRAQRLELYELPDYRPRKGRANDYGYDPIEQATETYTGMGHDINVHDQWAVESMGRIQDRSREHLGQSDRGIVIYRRLLKQSLDQVAAGGRPPIDPVDGAGLTGPSTMDGVGPVDDWQSYWREVDRRRRAGAGWMPASHVAPAASAGGDRL